MIKIYTRTIATPVGNVASFERHLRRFLCVTNNPSAGCFHLRTERCTELAEDTDVEDDCDRGTWTMVAALSAMVSVSAAVVIFSVAAKAVVSEPVVPPVSTGAVAEDDTVILLLDICRGG